MSLHWGIILFFIPVCMYQVPGIFLSPWYTLPGIFIRSMYQVLHCGSTCPVCRSLLKTRSRFRSSTRCRVTTHLGSRNAVHLVPRVAVIGCGHAVEAIPVYAPFHVRLCLLEQIVRDSFNDSRPAESICLATYPNEECTTIVQC